MLPKTLLTVLLALMATLSTWAKESNVPIEEYSQQVLELACSDEAKQQLGVSDEVIAQAWNDYLTQDEVIAQADPRAIFRLLSAVMPKLTQAQREEFAHRYYRLLFQTDPPRSVAPEELVLMGWCLVNSSLSYKEGSYPEFTQAVLDYVQDKDSLGPEALVLLEDIRVEPERFEAAMLTYLNLFWHEDIRTILDDSACPFYRALFSPNPVKWNYGTGYFLSMAFHDDAAKEAGRARLVDEKTGAPRRSIAEVLTWAYNSNKVVLSKGMPKTLDYSNPQWNAYLEERVADTSLSGDARAAWAVIRAFSMESSSYYPIPFAGREWIEKATELAESPSVRVDCVIRLALRLASTRQYDEAIEMMEKELTIVQDEDLLKRLNESLESVQHEQSLYAQWQAETQYKIKLNDILGLLRATRERIERARERGETPETIATYERSLMSIKRQLFELEQKNPANTQP